MSPQELVMLFLSCIAHFKFLEEQSIDSAGNSLNASHHMHGLFNIRCYCISRTSPLSGRSGGISLRHTLSDN